MHFYPCSSRRASDRESERRTNHAPHFPAIGECVFGIGSSGDNARIAIRNGKRIEAGKRCVQALTDAFFKKGQLDLVGPRRPYEAGPVPRAASTSGS